VPLGRRFRALKLWFVIRHYGVAEIRARIAAHIELAREAEDRVKAADDFELLVPRNLALFNFRYHPAGVDDEAVLNRLNETLLHRLNDSGEIYLTQNKIGDAYAIRFVVGQTGTERRHVQAAWDLIEKTARGLNG
jgi:aromatic-L-amino-acid decarboxylase